jgi:DNA repair protein RadA/Sms
MLRARNCQESPSKYPVKNNSRFICLACESKHDNYGLICHECQGSDTIVPIEEDEWDDMHEENKPSRRRAKKALLISADIPPMVSTGRRAWDIVLGGGLVRPSSVLIPGPAGVGKSTCLLAIADFIGNKLKKPVLYGSSEQPQEFIRRKCDALQLSMNFLYINDSGNAEDMHDDIAELRPAVVVWDSIHRFRVNGELGVSSLRDVVTGAIESGTRVRAASLLVSHVTKDEDFMGESGIGHDCDVVVFLSKVDQTTICIETRGKNRHAPTPLTATEELITVRL